MLSFRLTFSDEDMAVFFRSHCLVVKEVKFTEDLHVYHNMIKPGDQVVLCVINPITQRPIPVSVAFEKVILKRAKPVILDSISKEEVLEIFQKKVG